MRSRNHQWYLTRCSSCRGFILSSAPKCANCEAWQPGARAISVGLPALALATTLVAAILIGQTFLKIQHARAERRELLLQALTTSHSGEVAIGR